MKVWIVYDRSMCECGYCFGQEDIEVFTSEQTAKQAAEVRSRQYGGLPGRPDMHMEEIEVSTKVRSF